MAKKTKASSQQREEHIQKKELTPDSGENQTQPTAESEEKRNSKHKEFIEKLVKEHNEIINELGGVEEVQKQLKLTRAIVMYRKYGNTVEEITEAVLKEFRKAVEKKGYNGIEKDMIPIVERYGTIRDKSALCIVGYFDKTKDPVDKQPIISRSHIDEIKREIKKHGIEAQREFMNYLSIYDTIKNNFHIFYRLYNNFVSLSYQTTLYFNSYEWLSKAEEFFNAVSPLIDEAKKEKFRSLVEDYNNFLEKNQRFGILKEVETGADRWKDTQRDGCLGYADGLTEIATDKLKEVKGAIDGYKLWLKKYEAEMFMPMEVRAKIKEAENLIINELPDKYYHDHLRCKEERGETITEEDRKIALFPLYEEVEASADVTNIVISILDGRKENY